MLLTPSLLEAVLDSKHHTTLVCQHLDSLQTVILCGEVVTSVALASRENEKIIARLSCLEFIQCVSECHHVAALEISRMEIIKHESICPFRKLSPGVQAHVMDDAETTH